MSMLLRYQRLLLASMRSSFRDSIQIAGGSLIVSGGVLFVSTSHNSRLVLPRSFDSEDGISRYHLN